MATIVGNFGNNNLFGTAGTDTLIGLNGNDLLNGLGNADNMIGGSGNDTYVVDNFGDRVFEEQFGGIDRVISSVSFSLSGSIGTLNVENLTLSGGAAVNGFGNTLANVIVGNSAGNSLRGFGGNDVLSGLGGNDFMFGGTGNDRAFGGSGNDFINGGTGADRLDGGLGADRYDYNSVNEAIGDFILSFSRLQGDRIDLADIDANTNVAGDQAFLFRGTGNFTGAGQLRFFQFGGDTFIQGNVDGNLGADFTIRVDPLVSFVRTDFFL